MRISPPTEKHLARIYFELEKIGARAVGSKQPWPHRPPDKESLFALAAEWSRHDPRLLEILVQYGLVHWRELSGQRLRQEMAAMETPQTIGVIVSFIQSAAPQDRECRLFWEYVAEGLQPVEPQFYFRGLYLPGSRLAQRAALESVTEFKKWGFLGRERVIVDPSAKRAVGSWDQTARLNILKRLLETRKRIQISDYLEEIKQTISRQQALLDLKTLKAKPTGQGRSAGWRL